jgi:hypothetical protein
MAVVSPLAEYWRLAPTFGPDVPDFQMAVTVTLRPGERTTVQLPFRNGNGNYRLLKVIRGERTRPVTTFTRSCLRSRGMTAIS